MEEGKLQSSPSHRPTRNLKEGTLFMLSPLGASEHVSNPQQQQQPSPDAKNEGKNQKFFNDLYRRFNIKPLNACSLPNASPCRSRGVLKPLLKNEEEDG